MRDLVRLIVWAVVDLFRSRAALEAEILTLRQQIIVLRRTAPKKQSFGAIDRLVFVGLYRLFPRVLDALAIVRPGTVIRWHRTGWEQLPRYLIRDRDGVHGEVFLRRLRSMGIRDQPTFRVPHGKTDMPNGCSVRSGGNASTTLLCSTSATSVTYCCRT